jgi:hypothetical protein
MFMFLLGSLKTSVETGEGAFDGVILHGTMDSVLNDINGLVAAGCPTWGPKVREATARRPNDEAR